MTSSPAALLSGARPRVFRVPQAAESEGDLAGLLAGKYGLTPDRWQEDVLDGWLGRRRDGRYASATCGLAMPRQNGKNAVIEIRELFGMVGLGEKFLHTAHEVKTARKAFLRVASFFENERQFPELAALVATIRKTNGQEAISLRNGGGIEFIARSKGSGRGFTVDVLVCDEAQDLTDEELAALLPTISAAPLGNPQMILTGTPPDPEKRVRGEVFRRIRQVGEQNKDRRLCWADFGVADGPMPDIDDRKLWLEVNPTIGDRMTVAEVEREHGIMSPEEFARERLGWWGDPRAMSESLFGEHWLACRVRGDDGEPDEDFEPPEPLAIGLAVEIDRAWSSIGAAGELPDARRFVGAVDRRRGTSWVVDEVVRICTKHGVPVALDGKGPAADLVDPLEKRGVRVLVLAAADVADACAMFFDAVTETHTLAHAGHDDLDNAVRGAAKRRVGERFAWGRKQSLADVSMLEAVTFAAYHASHRSVYDTRDVVML